MRGALVACALLLAGCDQLFVLTEVTDAGATDAPPDVSIDARVCPGAASGADEDGDGCSNDVDDCPGIPDMVQLDQDGDGVGDACDPHPTLPGDSIALAAYFDGSTLDGNWMSDTVTWSVGGGVFTNTGPLVLSSSFGTASSSPSIELGYDVQSVVSGMASVHVTLATSTSVQCHVDANTSGTGIPEFEVFLVATDIGIIPGTVTTQRMRLATDASQSTCDVNGHSGTTTGIAAGPAQAKIELVEMIQVKIAYIIAYQYTSQ